MREYKIRNKNGEVINITGCLFIGLYDSAGEEIWEDDIVEYPAWNHAYSKQRKMKKIRGKVVYNISNTESGFDVVDIDDAGRYRFIDWSKFFDCKRVQG